MSRLNFVIKLGSAGIVGKSLLFNNFDEIKIKAKTGKKK